MGKFLLSIAFIIFSNHSLANGSITVTEPGDDGFVINTFVVNNTSFDITKITFDFSNAETTDGSYIVIDELPYVITGPSNGSATFFGNNSLFGFTFTGFNGLKSFNFEWDPDSAIDAGYGGSGLDFIGAKITAETTGGIYYGIFSQVGNSLDVTANLMPVPEPSNLALIITGTLFISFRLFGESKALSHKKCACPHKKGA